MKSAQQGASLTFQFEGSAFGLFDIGGPEAGQIEIEIDGKHIRLTEVAAKGYRFYQPDEHGEVNTINRFNAYCNNRYRGQYDIIKVKPGKHTVRIHLSYDRANKREILKANTEDIVAHPAKYDQSVLYLGRILLRGTPVYINRPMTKR
ncbi:hypothetical protein [Niabella ginsengisoli]|uniref:DUF4251 domain-containing protein n=1 Tax=Niabella ginsengisoli TaxID=522298 RepID=A0ABS9SJB3_9BACT|nr:hypothetical protein [Niabella ginsengisoli]MCH5598405.1 hypothetical protein [Niabella ginsengisoli]